MSDLIERLHDVAAESRNADGETSALIDAADEIDRLSKRIEQLEAVLREVGSLIEVAQQALGETKEQEHSQDTGWRSGKSSGLKEQEHSDE